MTPHPLEHPQGRFQLVAAASDVPPNHAGIKIAVSISRRAERSTLAPQIGVDGEPATYGWGNAIIVVPPGNHTVEAQYLEPMDSMTVTAAPGEVVSLVYNGNSYRPGELRDAADAKPPDRESRRAAGITTLVLLRAIGKVVLFAAAASLVLFGLLSVGVPQWLGILLFSLAGIPYVLWIFISEARWGNDRLFAKAAVVRQPSDRPGSAVPIALRRGEAPPTPPEAHGAVVVEFGFTSHVELTSGDAVIDDRPNWDRWIPSPGLSINGASVPAGWTRWWYPVPPGPNHLEMVSPAPSQIRIEVDAGTVVCLTYQAKIVFQKDQTDTTVLGRKATAQLSRMDAD